MRRWITYIQYFFYLGWNWSFPLALFIIRHEIRGEKKYNVNTIGLDDLTTSVSEDDLKHASIYQPVNYYTSERLFDNLNKNDIAGSFLDVGCGKGRVLPIAAAYGFTDIIGIDFSPKLCHEAISVAEKIEEEYSKCCVEIDCVDAREYNIPSSVSVIFMFNPFDDLVMNDFLKKVSETLYEYPRQLKILYANPQCKKQLLNAGFEEIFQFRKMKYLEGSIFVNRES